MLELNQLYNMDCMEGMREFPDNYFDLAIVDPPYGSANIRGGYMSNRGGGIAKPNQYNTALWSQPAPAEEYFKELMRVSKNQIIWGSNHFISKFSIDSPCWIVWDKENGDSSYADCELAWASFNSAVRRFTFRWSGMLQGNMKEKEVRIHPTQKPVVLYKWLLKNYAKPGDKILDTHVGSASSLIACFEMGFDYIGFEIDKGYFDKAQERLSAVMSQIRIF